MVSTDPKATWPRRDAEGCDVDVAVVGAGPTGLMIANLLGLNGIRVAVLEAEDHLIDFPRGVGMDDETLRTFQNAGLVDRVLQHTIPNQLLVFVDAKGRDLARLAPPPAGFGWPRRNGFVQPLADRVLLEGLERFENVDVHWATQVTDFTQDADRVSIRASTPGGTRELTAHFIVGADGGSSQTRKSLGVTFEGRSSAANWLVVDIRDDPLGRPGAWVHADPKRPYVSISIPHGIRRFEFMVLPGETEEQVVADDFIRDVLAPLIPRAAKVDIIRRRVYTHHSRMAGAFRSRRAFLIGDAAHIMPVWQGQGYNSGIRDAFNLSWKLAMAIKGTGGEALLDSYELERKDHARAMMELSTKVGEVVSIRNPIVAGLRNAFFRSISIFPKVKRYIVTMQFKPMPTMDAGALTMVGSTGSRSEVGRLVFQPSVRTVTGATLLLDDVTGPGFALIAWNNDPRALLDQDALVLAVRLGVRLVWARPAVQLADAEVVDDIVHVGDIDGSMKRYFDDRDESFLLVRPDRILAGASPAYGASDMLRAFAAAIDLPTDPPIATADRDILTTGSTS